MRSFSHQEQKTVVGLCEGVEQKPNAKKTQSTHTSHNLIEGLLEVSPQIVHRDSISTTAEEVEFSSMCHLNFIIDSIIYCSDTFTYSNDTIIYLGDLSFI